MAPLSQGSNQYGYWDRRGGQSLWVWYGQYALLRDLLFNRDYRPIPSNDYDGYRGARTGGHTYYGRADDNPSAGASAPKYGTQGASTQSRYSGSTYMRGGGFRDSQYATRSGGYRDSQFSSPSYKRRDDSPSVGSTPPRSFGWGSGSSGRSGSSGSSGLSRSGGSSGRTFGGSSRSSGRSFSSGGGRRFGGGGRRR